jgi:hypothetical protein
MNSDRFAPVEFLEILPPGASESSAIRLTSAGHPLTWGGDIYTPCSMGRGAIEEVMAVDSQNAPGVSISVQNIDLQLAKVLQRVEFEGSRATLWLADRRLLDRTRDAMQIITGEVHSPTLTDRVLTFQIMSVIGLTERILIPRRLHTQHCPFKYGSISCTQNVSLSPDTIQTTALSGSNESSVVVSSGVISSGGTDPSEFWKAGYLLFADGACALQARPIHRVAGQRIFVRHSFLSAPGVGDTLLVRRGCPKTQPACVDRQGSADNYGGFPDVPYERFKPIRFIEADSDPHTALIPEVPLYGT